MLSPLLTQTYGHSLAVAGPCYSAFVGSQVIACAGVVEFWTGRAQVWSLLSDQFPAYRKSVHRAVKTFLAGYRVRRLECVIATDSPRALNWAQHLGFRVEHRMAQYNPDGSDQLMLVRLER
jgi:hypothetical protein